jgi:hypothetical protein
MTETTIVQPGSSPSIYTTGDHGRHHGGHHHDGHRGFDAVESRADFRALTAEVERFGVANGDRINTAGAAAALAAAHNGEAIRDTSCHTDQLVLEGDSRTREVTQAGFGGVHDRLCDAKAGIIGAVERGFAAEALADCKLGDEIADSKLFNAVQFKDQVIEANKNAANTANLISTVGNAAQVLATTIGNAASVQATANYNGLTVQATSNFNQTTVQLERVRAELEAKTAAGFAAATLLAFQNKSDSDAKAAACCCELKALILEQGNATRAQAADFRMRDLESRLAAIPRGIPVTLPVGVV